MHTQRQADPKLEDDGDEDEVLHGKFAPIQTNQAACADGLQTSYMRLDLVSTGVLLIVKNITL